MYILKIETGEKHLARITRVDPGDITTMNKTGQFDFNWNKEKAFQVYQLTVEEKAEPVGLMSLRVRPGDYAVEIRLLASSKLNVGKQQEYGRIAGCMIAFACKESFKLGYDGFVCLIPKTRLVHHYINKYGFEWTKLFLYTEGKNSLNLIREYDEK